MSKTIEPSLAPRIPPLVWAGFALAAAGIAAGLAFGGWAAHGQEILNVLWATGLAWCL
jgi:hypothetical protein